MSDILVFTNRLLCRGDFLTRIAQIAEAKPRAIVLREKDLSEEEYIRLAEKAANICKKHGTPLILHNYAAAAKHTGRRAVHLPLSALRALPAEEKAAFTVLGASCHSVEDALEAVSYGCTYITAGNIFNTDCKPGLKGNGIAFLGDICRAVSIPVYAIGGINPHNISAVRRAGAAGACVMSRIMTCESAAAALSALEEPEQTGGATNGF